MTAEFMEVSFSLSHTHTAKGDGNWEKLEEMMESTEVGRDDGDTEWSTAKVISSVSSVI